MSKKKVCDVCTGKPVRLATEGETKRYFTAVVDVISRFGTVKEMPDVEPQVERYFNDGFVDSPEKALVIAIDIDNLRYKVPVSELMKNVEFEEAESEYVIRQYYTTNGNVPKDEQMKKFLAGEYAFEFVEFRIQVLETELIRPDLRDATVKKIKFPNR